MIPLKKTLLLIMDLIKAFSPKKWYSKTDLPINQLTSYHQKKINRILRWAESLEIQTVFICDSHKKEDFERLHEKFHALEGTKNTELMDWVYKPPKSLTFTKIIILPFLIKISIIF